MPPEEPSPPPSLMPDPSSAVPPSADTPLTARIAVLTAHIPDPDERAELAAHLEDLAAAYLSGDRRPSADDALLLAKSHLGPRAFAPRPLPRALFTSRLLTAASAMAVAWFLTTLLAAPIQQWLIFPFQAVDKPTPLAFIAATLPGALCFLLLLAATLRYAEPFLRATRKIASSPITGLLLAVLAFALNRITIFLPTPGYFTLSDLPNWILPWWLGVATAASFASLLFWNHFTLRPHASLRQFLLATAAWALTMVVLLALADPLHPFPIGFLAAHAHPWFLHTALDPLYSALFLLPIAAFPHLFREVSLRHRTRTA